MFLGAFAVGVHVPFASLPDNGRHGLEIVHLLPPVRKREPRQPKNVVHGDIMKALALVTAKVQSVDVGFAIASAAVAVTVTHRSKKQVITPPCLPGRKIP